VVFVMISFLMTLGIFVLLMRTAYFKPISWIVRVVLGIGYLEVIYNKCHPLATNSPFCNCCAQCTTAW
jgi:hypothetical protein